MKYFSRSIVLLCVVGIAFGVYKAPSLTVIRKFEKVEPEIDLATPIVGIGLKGTSGSVSAKDDGSGIAEIWVELSQEQGAQGQKILPVAHQLYDTELPNVSLAFEIPKLPREFTNGPASLLLRARDTSYWGNQKRVEKPILIDLVNPKVEILSGTVNTEHGGVGMVFFRVIKESLPKNREIKLGELSFPTYPAQKLDAAFADKPDIFFGLFTVPFGFDNTKQEIKVVITNEVGNQGQAAVVTHIKPRKRPRADLKLNKFFLETRVDELMQAFEMTERNTSPEPEQLGKDLSTIFNQLQGLQGDQLLATRFRIVNEDFRKEISKTIHNATKNTEAKQLWDGVFIRPIAAKTTSRFAEERFYSYEGMEAGGSFHDGLDLASVSQAPVQATNNGRVLFVGDLGIYGNAVILDHGFGLTSLYGHLSNTSVTEGQEVTKGEQIGRTGQTGLAGGDHLHFEIRLNDIPVNPIEWWDSKWIHDRIETKNNEVKDFLKDG